MRVSILIVHLVVCIIAQAADSTSHYFIQFKDKASSVYSIERPWEFLSVEAIDRRAKYGIAIDESDLPVNSNYIEALKIYSGVKVVQSTKWLNGVEVVVEKSEQIKQLEFVNFISKITYLGSIEKREQPIKKVIDSRYYDLAKALIEKKSLYKDSGITLSLYGKSIEQIRQIGLPLLHQKKFRGDQVHIAVLDAGFNDAYQVEGMEDLLNGCITKDFVDYDNSVWEDDSHGARVLSLMKTFNPGKYVGTAPFSRYTLIRTEIGSQESLLEELKWVFGAEFADSLGVDLIIGSIGYHTFDNANFNHKYSDLDGKTTIAAKGANFAHSKGIAVICSAGNEGRSKWKKIGTPADALGSIAIGACNANGFYADFSSTGFNSNKPNFVASGFQVMIASPSGFYRGNGTSYATPIFAGAFACLMGAFPTYSVDTLKFFLDYSSSNYAQKDTFYGSGVPDFGLAFSFIKNTFSEKDILWEHSIDNFYGDLLVILRSSQAQKVKISITAKRDKKDKKIATKVFKLEQSEWLKYDVGSDFTMIEKKIKKYKDVKSLQLIIETEEASYLRTFKLTN